jgi:amidase
MRLYIESGQRTPRDEYIAAWRRVEECRGLLPAVLDGLDILLVPCVPGEAPRGLGFTGDPSMQAMWTALHTPTITLPTHRGPHNLPVGIQLVGQRYDDDRLLACARWIWEKVGAPELIGCSPDFLASRP